MNHPTSRCILLLLRWRAHTHTHTATAGGGSCGKGVPRADLARGTAACTRFAPRLGGAYAGGRPQRRKRGAVVGTHTHNSLPLWLGVLSHAVVGKGGALGIQCHRGETCSQRSSDFNNTKTQSRTACRPGEPPHNTHTNKGDTHVGGRCGGRHRGGGRDGGKGV